MPLHVPLQPVLLRAALKEHIMETVIIEIRAAEGGDDAKLLVTDQLRAYANAASRRGL